MLRGGTCHPRLLPTLATTAKGHANVTREHGRRRKWRDRRKRTGPSIIEPCQLPGNVSRQAASAASGAEFTTGRTDRRTRRCRSRCCRTRCCHCRCRCCCCHCCRCHCRYRSGRCHSGCSGCSGCCSSSSCRSRSPRTPPCRASPRRPWSCRRARWSTSPCR